MADGVSQCEKSADGAKFVCELLGKAVLTEADYLFGLSERKIAGLLVNYIQTEIRKMAEKEDIAAEKYSSTVSFICYHRKKNKILTFNLGDSCIYAVSNQDIRQLDISNTYFYNTCSTMTMGVQKETVVRIYNADEFDSVFLCTDGFWKMMENDRKKKNELKKAICNNDFGYITAFAENSNNSDDCTFGYFTIEQ